MAKPTRKKRRRRRQPRQHNFTAEPKTAERKNETKPANQIPPKPKTTTENILTPPPGQRADIIMTLTIAGVIFVAFGLIAYMDSTSHFLVQLGEQLTSFLGLSF